MKKNAKMLCHPVYRMYRKTWLVMKQIIFLSLVFMVHAHANTYSQNAHVNLDLKNANIIELIKEIERQTDMGFVYDVKVVNNTDQVTLKVRDQSVDEVLEKVIDRFGLSYEIYEQTIILKSKEEEAPVEEMELQQPQKTKFIGKVINENGNPVPFATVVIKGTTLGTATDENGNFSFTVIEGDYQTLVASSIGLVAQEIEIAGKTYFEFELKTDVSGIDEVMVIGYGAISREKATGAATKVNPVVLQNSPNVSFADALIGIVPGLLVEESFSNPDTPPSLLLRGVGSINAGTEPLVVVDGVQMPNGFSSASINANDIEGMSILKDAAATSIYGSRGSNGVILITTKKGKQNTKPQVSFNARLGVRSTNNSFADDIMSASEKLDYENSLGLYPADDADAQALLASRRSSGNNINWSDLMLQNEFNERYDISVNGGGEKSTYHASIVYDGVDNIFGSNYERFVAKLRLDFEIAKNLNFGISGNFGNTNNKDRRTTGNPVSNSFLLNPWEDVYDEDNNPLRTLNYAISGFGVPYNPLFFRDNTEIESTRRNIYGNATLSYKPYEWLTLNGNIGGNFNHSRSSSYEKVIIAGGELTRTNGDNNNYTGTITATVDKTVDLHSFNFVAGYEFNENENYSQFATARNFLSDATQIINAAQDLSYIREGMSHSGSVSYFSRLNYSFNNTYNLSLSIRRDGSSKFGDNNKWANFWAAGASWNIHKSLNLDNNSVLSTLKVRGSYGTSGNDFIGDFDPLSLYQFRNSYDGNDVATLSRGENPNLTWEKNTNTNIGLDIGLNKNRTFVTFDYYIRDTYDLINNVPIPLQSGFEDLTSNIGDFRNKGIEISLRSSIIQSENFSWNTNLNFAFNESEVLDLVEDDDIIQRGNVVFKKGSPIRALYLAEWLGVNPETGFNQYLNPDATGEDDRIIEFLSTDRSPNRSEIASLREVTDKTGTPKYHGGFTNVFAFKNFDASILISFAGGHYVLNDANYDLRNVVFLNQHKDVLSAWQQPGDGSTLAVRALNNRRPTSRRTESDYAKSTQFLQDADYVKLKNITIGYTLDKSLSQKIGLDRLRFYVQGQNLLTITDVDYIDPEYSSLGGVGFSSTIVKGYSFGISANF